MASIGAVIDALSLGSPLLVGHSLGGMLALAHLGRDGAGSGLIDVDGWVGPPLPNRFTSEALSGIEDQLLATAVATRDGLDNLIALQRSVGSAEGQDLDATEAVLRRSYPFGEGDKAFRRPTPAESIARMRHLAEVDLRVRADELGVPVLFVMATKYQAASGLTEEEFQADRVALSDWLETAGWSTERVGCSHLIPLLRPAELARIVMDFGRRLEP